LKLRTAVRQCHGRAKHPTSTHSADINFLPDSKMDFSVLRSSCARLSPLRSSFSRHGGSRQGSMRFSFQALALGFIPKTRREVMLKAIRLGSRRYLHSLGNSGLGGHDRLAAYKLNVGPMGCALSPKSPRHKAAPFNAWRRPLLSSDPKEMGHDSADRIGSQACCSKNIPLSMLTVIASVAVRADENRGIVRRKQASIRSIASTPVFRSR